MSELAFKEVRLNGDFRYVPTWKLKRAYKRMFAKWEYYIRNNWPNLAKDFEDGMKKIAKELDDRKVQ